MNVQEFSIEFDIKYNNIKSQAAPGLDEYEKSVFLTNALEGLVLDTYEGRNDKRESFEETEIKRRYLDRLIKQITVPTPINISDTLSISDDSIFFEIPADLMLITNEQLVVTSNDECNENVTLDIIPVRQDEYLVHKKNPFRKPNLKGRTNQAWRLDYGDNELRLVELIVPKGVITSQYKVRYIKKPNPIILQDLAPLELSINGISEITECELDSIIHREITDRAVRLADIAYKFNGVQPQQ